MGLRDKIWLESKKAHSLEISLFKFTAMNEGKKEKNYTELETCLGKTKIVHMN